MAIVGKRRLEDLMSEGTPLGKRLIVTPVLDWPRGIGNGSVDVRLGTHFVVVKDAHIGGIEPFVPQTPTESHKYQEMVYVPFNSQLWIHPGTFVLGGTLEYLRLPENLHADVTARSSWARLGLSIASAFAIHPGFYGCLTLELVNSGNTPVAIHPGDRIGQLTFHDVEPADPIPDWGTKYEGYIMPWYSLLENERGERDRWKNIGRSMRGRK